MTLRAVSWRAVSTREQAEDDKASLEAQDFEHKRLIELNQWRLVADLVVPGHSRSYVDFYELADDAEKAGISAFKDLMRMCQARAFDVLLVRDGDRLAREQAPIAFMVSRIIESGARIFSVQDGWVDEKNYRMTSMVWGYRASTEIDQLKIRFSSGKRKKTLERGIFTQGKPPFGFKQVRNDNGQLVGTVIDESCRPIFNDVAALVLERVTWKFIERELYARFGHVHPRHGKPFKPMAFYHWFHTPWIWGHAAQMYMSPNTPNGQKSGIWAFDDTVLPPPDVRIEYNKREPVYTGELASRLKAELRRRRMLKGTGYPNSAHMFTGLLVCGECGYYMSFSKHKREYRAYRCASKYAVVKRDACDRYRYIGEKTVVRWLQEKLDYMAEHDYPDMLARKPDKNQPQIQLEDIHRRLVKVDEQAAILIRKQALADEALADIYDNELQAVAERRVALKRLYDSVEREQREQDTSGSVAAFEEYVANRESYWQQEHSAINQHLHRLFGNRRMAVIDSEISDIVDAPPVSQPHHGKRRKRKL